MLQNIVPVDAPLIARFLRDSHIGGLSVSRAEAGPRALGNRSILASASSLKTKERINGMIKKRLAFQPLAPVCLDEDVHLYFELPKAEVSLRSMTCALRCLPETQAVAPAIVHVDGTARVQAVTEETPLLHAILRAYRSLTGVGLLINTSLNGPGQPIANTATDAFLTYRSLDLDFVVIDRFLISSRLC